MRSSWIWVAFALNCGAGLWWSPVTALRKLRIEGATPPQVEAIRSFVISLRETPALRVDNQRLLTRVLSDAEIHNVQWQQNLFGRGVLKVNNRVAAVSVEGPRNLMLAKDGTMFGSSMPAKPLMRVRTDLPAFKPAFTFAGTWEARAVARLASLINVEIPSLTGTLIQDRAGKIMFASGELALVIFGTTDNAVAKVSQLKRALTQQPKLLSQVKEVNMSAPENPRYVPLANTALPSKK